MCERQPSSVVWCAQPQVAVVQRPHAFRGATFVRVDFESQGFEAPLVARPMTMHVLDARVVFVHFAEFLKLIARVQRRWGISYLSSNRQHPFPFSELSHPLFVFPFLLVPSTLLRSPFLFFHHLFLSLLPKVSRQIVFYFFISSFPCLLLIFRFSRSFRPRLFHRFHARLFPSLRGLLLGGARRVARSIHPTQHPSLFRHQHVAVSLLPIRRLSDASAKRHVRICRGVIRWHPRPGDAFCTSTHKKKGCSAEERGRGGAGGMRGGGAEVRGWLGNRDPRVMLFGKTVRSCWPSSRCCA